MKDKNDSYIKITRANEYLAKKPLGKNAVILNNDGSLVGYYKNLRKLYELIRKERVSLIETCKIKDCYVLGVEFNDTFRFYINFGCKGVLSKIILKFHKKVLSESFFNEIVLGPEITEPVIFMDKMEEGFLCQFFYPKYSDSARIEVMKVKEPEIKRSSLGKKWVCTDPDTKQFQRKIAEDVYEFKEYSKALRKNVTGTIDLKDYTEDEKTSCLESYGYSLKTTEPELLAECLWEQEFLTGHGSCR